MSPRVGYAIFSVNTFLAAMLALFISFSIGLERPYWAILTVYITVQPLTGALRSKAVYRFFGTLLGGTAAVVIVPRFVNSPAMMSLVLACWTGLCLYLSLLDRTPRAYVFMLAGYTAAIIGFPSVNAPNAIFDTALARTEEISLGIFCATLVHTLVFPRDVGQALTGRIAGVLSDSQTWIGDALTGRRGPSEREERRRIANDVTELHITSSHLPFDTASLPLRIDTVRVLENRLAYTLPLITAIEDRLAQLEKPSRSLSRLLADVVAWAEAKDAPDHQYAVAARLTARCRALTPLVGDGEADWEALLTTSILVRLEELIQAFQDSRDLAGVIAAPEGKIPPRVTALLRYPPRRPLHLDHGMAALSGMALVVAVLGCCALWIFSAWPEGATAAMFAAIMSSFFAAQDDPAPAMVAFLIMSIVSAPFAALYLFAILPAVDGFPMLMLTLAPALLFLGYLQAGPKTAPMGIALILGFVGSLNLQATFSAGFPEFLNNTLALDAGIAIALAATRLFRSVGAGWAARRILRRGWREVAALARRPHGVDADAWASAMLDRLGLISARVTLSAPEDIVDAQEALVDMRVGLNVLDLHAAAHAIEHDGPSRSLRGVLAAVAHAFERRGAGEPVEDQTSLLGAIDRAIGDLAAMPIERAPPRGFTALVGLRRNLFPQAAPYAPARAGAA